MGRLISSTEGSGGGDGAHSWWEHVLLRRHGNDGGAAKASAYGRRPHRHFCLHRRLSCWFCLSPSRFVFLKGDVLGDSDVTTG